MYTVCENYWDYTSSTGKLPTVGTIFKLSDRSFILMEANQVLDMSTAELYFVHALDRTKNNKRNSNGEIIRIPFYSFHTEDFSCSGIEAEMWTDDDVIVNETV